MTMRWKGHQPTVQTHTNACHRYYLDVRRYMSVAEDCRDVEEDIRLSVESRRLDAMRAWVYHGQVIDRRWFVEAPALVESGNLSPT